MKKESAQTEPAWKGAGDAVGLQIWRIVKFKVTHWPKEDYGKFYDGDSYIILHTYKKPEGDVSTCEAWRHCVARYCAVRTSLRVRACVQELLYDVHFWIGRDSTQDEYGTAAYKTVELDTLVCSSPAHVKCHPSGNIRKSLGINNNGRLIKYVFLWQLLHVSTQNVATFICNWQLVVSAGNAALRHV